jgi:hypothetical protein
MTGAEQFVVARKELVWLWSQGVASSSLDSLINCYWQEELYESGQAATDHLAAGFCVDEVFSAGVAVADGLEGLSAGETEWESGG